MGYSPGIDYKALPLEDTTFILGSPFFDNADELSYKYAE